ncbi:hypothetical protein CTAYLR_001631 [Chrysophaeum taylorii]|uniref:Lecithin:cholesterol acyltransferase n=1 Tax=Chrysophaeum taylorii TaxID=2483200 RepID=A0AAD7XJV7_9STRA|nr:hypothetical protein CTAYLR_001631 [Chrysophaeum taylorii]
MKDAPSCASRPDEGLDSIYTLASGVLGMFSHSMMELIEGLTAELGYDPTRLHAMPYDFRVTPDLLETRDGYFSRLKALIEVERKRLGKRAIVLGHSWGCRIFAYFLEWLKVETPDRIEWIDHHIAMYFANGAPIYGAPDIATSLIVGATQGMPISLKLIHEVLASAGGLTNLIPTPTVEDPCGGRHDHELPWLRVSSGGLFGPRACDGPDSAIAFFREAARNDSHAADIAAFIERTCEDPLNANAHERPPVDTVHVAYGVGLGTRIQTTFALLPGETTQTLPYFADQLSLRERERYTRPARTWIVNGSVDEVGLNGRDLVDEKSEILKSGPGRSGDDTVPYVSLAAAHAWLDCDSVAVSSIPLRKLFTRDEIRRGVYDRRDRRAVYETNDDDDEEENRYDLFESSTVRNDRRAERTIIMEMHRVAHRGSAIHPVYVDYVIRQIRAHVDTLRNHADDLLIDDVHQEPHQTTDTLVQDRSYEPATDDDCVWSFVTSSCAFPSRCTWRYQVGDLSLSQSCRLRRRPPPDL